MTTLTPSIRAALQGRLITATGLPTSRAWENLQFTPVPGTPYVEAFLSFLPALGRFRTGPIALGTGSMNRHLGIFQANLYYPNNQGPNAADTAADNVRAVFKTGDLISYPGNVDSVHVIRAYRKPAVEDATWYMVPVLIEWRTDALSTQ